MGRPHLFEEVSDFPLHKTLKQRYLHFIKFTFCWFRNGVSANHKTYQIKQVKSKFIQYNNAECRIETEPANRFMGYRRMSTFDLIKMQALSFDNAKTRMDDCCCVNVSIS
jgi:hypothetical protein